MELCIPEPETVAAAATPVQRALAVLAAATSSLQTLAKEVRFSGQIEGLCGRFEVATTLERLAAEKLQGHLKHADAVVQRLRSLLDNYRMLDIQVAMDDAPQLHKEAASCAKQAMRLKKVLDNYRLKQLGPAREAYELEVQAAAAAAAAAASRRGVIAKVSATVVGVAGRLALRAFARCSQTGQQEAQGHPGVQQQKKPGHASHATIPQDADPPAAAILEAVEGWVRTVLEITRFVVWLEQDLRPVASALMLPGSHCHSGGAQYVTAAAALERHWRTVQEGAEALDEACRQYSFATLDAGQQLAAIGD